MDNERLPDPCYICNNGVRRLMKRRRIDEPDEVTPAGQVRFCFCNNPMVIGLPQANPSNEEVSEDQDEANARPAQVGTFGSPPNHSQLMLRQPQAEDNSTPHQPNETLENSNNVTVEVVVTPDRNATLPIPAPSPGPSTPGLNSSINILSRLDELGWQETRPTLTARAGFLLNNPRMSDVRFLVGESKQEVFAHKTMLSLGSPVFEAQFFGGVGGSVNLIELPDFEPDTFMLFLKYLYTDQLDENLDDAQLLNLLRPAKKYIVPHLVDKCSDILMTELRPENIFQILHHAQFFQLRKLEGACERYIDRNSGAIVISEEFTNLSKVILTDFLKRDGLNIREEALFQAVVRWATAECLRNSVETNYENLREVLGDCLRLIRFPTMSREEFAAAYERTSILSPEDACSVFVYMCKPPGNALPDGTLLFPVVKRCFSPQSKTVSRFSGEPFEHSLNYRSGEIYNYRVNFKADRHVFFKGVNIFSIRTGSSNPRTFSGALYLYEKSTSIQEGRKQFNKTGSLEADDEVALAINGDRRQFFPVILESEVPLQPGKLYTVCVVVSVNCNNYGAQPLLTYIGMNERKETSVVFEDSLTVNFTFPGSSVDCNVGRFTCAQIPEIIFSL